ncbi:hypothetical protein QTP88_021321 [Uroleucon formosanum]
MNEEGIIQKFQAHFKNVLNVDQGVREEIVDTVYHTAQPLVEEPNHEEVKDIIATLKNNKAPGEDNINSELLKIGTQQLVTKIHGLLKQIWNTNRIPEDWKTAVICPIYKKGDPMDTSNYRGIALLDSCYKILSLALLRRLEVYSKDLIGDYQSGFKNLKYPKKLIDLIKACNTNTMCKVKFGNGTSDRFEVSTGLKQGDALSPVLFNLALEKVIRSMPMRQDMELLSNSTLLAYADDIVIIGSTRQDVAIRTNDLLKAAKPMGLEVNQDKTKYLVMTRGTRDISDLVVENYTFQQVENFKYLGANINQYNYMHNEIKIRISVANKGYYALEKLFKSKFLSRRSKERLYLSFLRPVLTIACETWSITKGDEEKMACFERRILRRIYGPILENEVYRRRTNKEVQQIYQKPGINAYLMSKRIEWAGHVWRSNGILKKALEGKINGKRPRGRPRQRWIDRVKGDIDKCAQGLTLEDSVDRDS